MVQRTVAALRGRFPMVDDARQTTSVRLCVFPDKSRGRITAARRLAGPDHIVLYALFSITVCRHALMAGFRST